MPTAVYKPTEPLREKTKIWRLLPMLACLAGAAVMAGCGTPEPAAVATSAPASGGQQATSMPPPSSAPLATSALEPTMPPPPATATLPTTGTPESGTEPANDSPAVEVTPASGADLAQDTPAPRAPRATLTPALGRPSAPPKPPPPVAPAPTDDWQTFRSAARGFVARYPAGWSVAEGDASTSFAAPGSDAQIVVRTAPGMIEPGQPHDLPSNARCRTVAVGAAAGTRCGDTVTITRSPAADGSTTLVTISATPGVDAATFEAFLRSFRFA